MFNYSEHSIKHRATLHPQLRVLCDHILKIRDIRVNGWRGEKSQSKLFKEGRSKVQYPNSRHNRSILLGAANLSDAVDLEIFVDGKVTFEPMYYIEMNGIIQSWAKSNRCKITWGGNWDRDQVILTDQSFDDLMHWQIEEVNISE